ncbi:MAG: SAM-dependent methyltransferase [Clostridia bacterium]|nr:SAM-dependent methyltransferase [Clostridia bacterium]
MKLSPRLQTVADAAGKCKILADVGTDHGYIPVYMLQNSLCEKAYASDIREQPLARAKSTIEENGFSAVAETYLSDGIRNIPGDYDCLVIAGMGGETIVSILEAKKLPQNVKLVLQPMTEEVKLREYLYTHGFKITDETAVSEPGHVYTVITAESGESATWTFRDILASPAFCSKKSADAEAYIMKYIRKESRTLEGLKNSNTPKTEEIAEVEKRLYEYGKILELIKNN